jgi:hypothetical protein
VPKATNPHSHLWPQCGEVCPRTRRQRYRRVPCAVGCSRRHGNACACQYPASTRPGTASTTELRLRALRWITPQPSTSSHSPCNTIICHGAYNRQRYGTCQHTMCHMAICHREIEYAYHRPEGYVQANHSP